MRIKVLGAFGSEGQGQRPSAFLVNERILVDAGSVGGALTVPEQVEIEHALLSHAHLDHVVGLAFLTDTLAMMGASQTHHRLQHPARRRRPPHPLLQRCPLAQLHRHPLPRERVPAPPGPARKESESRVGELEVTPVVVHHTVVAAGYVIRDGDTGFVYTGDTGPTSRIWELARDMRGLKAMLVETAFPNRLDALARASGHLTPEMLRREIDKMPRDVPIWVFHVKPQLFQETAEELARIDPARIHILEQGKTYTV